MICLYLPRNYRTPIMSYNPPSGRLNKFKSLRRATPCTCWSIISSMSTSCVSCLVRWLLGEDMRAHCRLHENASCVELIRVRHELVTEKKAYQFVDDHFAMTSSKVKQWYLNPFYWSYIADRALQGMLKKKKELALQPYAEQSFWGHQNLSMWKWEADCLKAIAQLEVLHSTRQLHSNETTQLQIRLFVS